jgi:hypothetical protein
VQAVLDAEAQELVPRGMKLDLVDPLAETVVRPQLRRMLVCEPAPLERLAAEQGAERTQLRVRPGSALACDGFDQRPVLAVEVVPRERRRLVRARGRGVERHRRTAEA